MIPRLELVACHMSVNLLDNAKKALTGYRNWIYGLTVQLSYTGFKETVTTDSL